MISRKLIPLFYAIALVGISSTLITAWRLPHWLGGPDPRVDAYAYADLTKNLNELGLEHVFFGTLYNRALVAQDANGQQFLANRMLKNAQDIGNRLGSYYDNDTKQRLISLLQRHNNLSADAGKALVQRDQSKVQELSQRWKDNADDLAYFLQTINPNWSQHSLRDFLNKDWHHGRQDLQTLQDKKTEQNLNNLDQAIKQINKFNDYIVHGLVKQFSKKFRRP
jgi:hypothetical protein